MEIDTRMTVVTKIGDKTSIPLTMWGLWVKARLIQVRELSVILVGSWTSCRKLNILTILTRC